MDDAEIASTENLSEATPRTKLTFVLTELALIGVSAILITTKYNSEFKDISRNIIAQEKSRVYKMSLKMRLPTRISQPQDSILPDLSQENKYVYRKKINKNR